MKTEFNRTGAMPLQEKADRMVSRLKACAEQRVIPLKLRH